MIANHSEIDLTALPMRIAVGQINELTDEHLAFARQVGAEDIQMNTPKLPGEHRWETDDLIALRRRAESQGLRLIALENIPALLRQDHAGPTRPRRTDGAYVGHGSEYGGSQHTDPWLPLDAERRMAHQSRDDRARRGYLK